jgi:large subunit ribosomal protein L21
MSLFRAARLLPQTYSFSFRFFSTPRLASECGIDTWHYARPYLAPFRFEHPTELVVPASIPATAAPIELDQHVSDEVDDVEFEQDELVNEEDAAEDEAGNEEDDMDYMEDDAILEAGSGDVFAVVDINKRQYKVSEGCLLMADRLQLEVGEEVIFEHLLMAATKDYSIFGRPLIAGRVVCVVEAHDETEKLIVFKKRRRKGYQRQKYHTSLLTLLRVTKIDFTDQAPVMPLDEELPVEDVKSPQPRLGVYPKPKMSPNERRKARVMAKVANEKKNRVKRPGAVCLIYC